MEMSQASCRHSPPRHYTTSWHMTKMWSRRQLRNVGGCMRGVGKVLLASSTTGSKARASPQRALKYSWIRLLNLQSGTHRGALLCQQRRADFVIGLKCHTRRVADAAPSKSHAPLYIRLRRGRHAGQWWFFFLRSTCCTLACRHPVRKTI